MGVSIEEMIKKYNTKQNPLTRSQRRFVAEELKKKFNSCPLYSRLGATQQMLGRESIFLKFCESDFDYSIETSIETEVKDKETEAFIKTYIFEMLYQIAGFIDKDMSIKIKTEIKEDAFR